MNYLELEPLQITNDKPSTGPCKICGESRRHLIAKSRSGASHNHQAICASCIEFFPSLDDVPDSLNDLFCYSVFHQALQKFIWDGMFKEGRYVPEHSHETFIAKAWCRFAENLKESLSEFASIKELITSYEKYGNRMGKYIWDRKKKNTWGKKYKWDQHRRFHYRRNGRWIHMDMINFFRDRVDDACRTEYSRMAREISTESIDSYLEEDCGCYDTKSDYCLEFAEKEGEFSYSCIAQDLIDLGGKFLLATAKRTELGDKRLRRDLSIWRAYVKIRGIANNDSDAIATIANNFYPLNCHTVKSVILRVKEGLNSPVLGFRVFRDHFDDRSSILHS